MEWPWIIAVLLAFIFFALEIFAPVPRRLKAGPIEMDWRDILAIFLVVILGIAYYRGELSAKEIAAIIGGILVGKVGGILVRKLRS